jgi:ornithine--oxo-acid transaminase
MAERIDVAALLTNARTGARDSHFAHMNPAFAKLVELIGFDRSYVRGEGQYLWDAQGHRVLDCLAGYGALALGRAHPVVTDALVQCLTLAPPAWVRWELNPLAAEAARRLTLQCRVGADRVFFTNSGTEAIEAAIKFARQHTGRPGLLAWSDSFHGLTCGSLSINGNEDLRRGFGPLLPGAAIVEFGDLEALERALSGRDVAALVVEPVQGKTLRTLSPGVLQEAHALCKRYGTLLIADEVQTGAGRTGAFLAVHHDGVEPDMVVLAKALSGGFVPVGAVLVRSDIWDSTFSSMDRSVVHSSTFHEGPLAMVALLATLEVIEQDHLAARAAELGELLIRQLRAECADIACVREIRGKGLMVGVDLDTSRIPSFAKIPMLGRMTEPMIGQAAIMQLLDVHSILAQTTGARRPLLKFVPPLIVNEGDVQAIVAATAASCRSLASGRFYGAMGSVASNMLRTGLGLSRA